MDIKVLKKDEINIDIKICISKYIDTYFSQNYLFEIHLHSVSGIDVSKTSSSSITKIYLSCIL